MTTMGKIGLLNGGGDCPGLNAVTRAVVRTTYHRYNGKVIGIFDGFDGLIWPERSKELPPQNIRGILPRGGTILGTTNSGNPFKYKVEQNGSVAIHDYSERVIENIKKLELEALVVVGGDGTLGIAREFHLRGVPLVGVPKTIDNDLSATDVTFGFDTALHTATDAIDKIHTTAESHGRVMIIEVMGRDAGWIALQAGMAGGADVILIPEIPFLVENVCRHIDARKAAGNKFTLIVVAEGCRIQSDDPVWVAHKDEAALAVKMTVGNLVGALIGRERREDVRVTVLGHLQRGGTPSPFDRLLSTRLGVAAVDLVAGKQFGRMVCLRGNEISSCTLDDAVGRTKTVPPDCDTVRAAQAIGISFGAD
jgi:ATP-dependent phosphofructokinase / diphosphate-dependent phosphofructokinase